jgi:hypothetical protein
VRMLTMFGEAQHTRKTKAAESGGRSRSSKDREAF